MASARSLQLRGIWPGAVFAAVAVAAACLLARGNGVLVLSRLVIDGGIVVLWGAGAVGLGGYLLTRFFWSLECGRAFWVAMAAGLGWGVMSLGQLGLGLAGLIGGGWAWGMVGVGLALGGWQAWGREMAKVGGRVWYGGLVFAPLAGAVLFLAMAPAGLLWPGEPNGYDVAAYHLQLPREWYELGRIVPLHHNVFSYFPMGVEMHYLMAMELGGGPWAGMYTAQMMHVAFFAAAGLGAFGALSSGAMRGGRMAGVVGALVICGCPYCILLAPIAYDEGGTVLYGTLVLGVLLRRKGAGEMSVAEFALAGVFAGMAGAAKLTSIPLWVVGPILVVMAGARYWGGVGRWKRVGAFAAGAGVVLMPWLVRTAVWSGGNPVFPVMARQLGAGHFTAEQVARFEKAHSPRPEQRSVMGRLQAFEEQVLGAAEFGWTLIPAAAIAGVYLAWARWWGKGRLEAGEGGLRGGLVFLLAGHVAVWLFATHLQGRFFVPAVPVLAFLLAEVRWVGLPAAVVSAGISAVLPFVRLTLPAEAFGVDLSAPGMQAALFPGAGLQEIPAERTLTLVGDARAYFYPHPMKTLKYTSAFDAVGADAAAAWRLAPGDAAWVDPNELARLARTYGTPAPRPDWRQPQAFLLDQKN